MAQIDPNTVQWDAPPQPVGKPVTGAKDQPLQGGVILPGKPEKPEKPTETFRLATEAEKKAAGLDPNRAYQISNITGEFKDVGGQPTAKPAAVDPNRIMKINSALDALANIRQLAEKSLSVGETAGRVRETPLIGAVLGQNRADLEGALSLVEGNLIQDQLAVLAQINPGGIASLANAESEARRLASSIANLDPNQSQGQFLTGVQRAEEYYKRQLEQLGGKREPVAAAGGGAPPPTVAPIKAGEAFQTEADLAAQRQLQDAWARGLSVDELIQFNQQIGRGAFSPEDIQRMRDARAQNKPEAIRFYATPTGQPEEELGFFEGIAESVTGSRRSTPEIEALPEWVTMPELNELSIAGAKTGLGTMFTSPEESVQIIKANYPGVQVRQDAKGNYILRSSIDGREYGIQPGFRWGDVPRVAGGILAFTPAGRATTIAGAAGGSALTQAGIEATQAATGGEFNTSEVGIAGLGGAGGKIIEPIIPAAVSAVRGIRRGPEVPAGAVMPEIPPVAGMAPEAPPMAAMAPEMPPVAAGAPSPAPAAPAAAAPAPTPEMAAELGTIIREASGTGMKAKGAQIKLAEMAQINPEAKAAAERLGIEVPVDVFADNPQVRSAIGLTRSLAGGEAEAAWRNAVSNAVDQADNVMRSFDAQFIEGAVSPGTVSQRVKDSLTKTRADLNAEASAIYKRVDESVPKQTPVQMDNLFRELTAIAGEVGESGMTAQEKRLMGLIQSGEAGGGDITYGRLIREKNLIGKALKREESPYGSLDEATLKRLYAALATDQLDNVGRIGGEELRSQLRGANLIYAKERALGERIVNAFGRDLEGGIANKMRAAITGAAKGEPGDFARLMKAVPADLRKEVVATALTAAARSTRGAEKGGFGFSEFADLYPKLRANPQVYKQIVETLGPKAADTLRDLFQVSKRITEARANVLTTGKANQALVESLNAESIIAKIMDSTAAKRAVGAVAGLGGPVTGAVMPDIMQAMSKGNPDAVRAAGKMFASPEFQALLTEAATQPEVTGRAINRAASSQRFRDFAKTIGLELGQGRNWLRSIITAGTVQSMGPEAGPPAAEPPAGAIVTRPQQ